MDSPAYGVVDGLPQEILENITYHLAASSFLGPPSNIIPFVTANRWTYSCLSLSSNLSLYARIFEEKFDVGPAIRRFGSTALSAKVLSDELKKRCVYLKRIRSRADACMGAERDNEMLRDVLSYMYLFMLENEGKNEKQLREYAHIDMWLKDFWFHEQGSSMARQAITHMDRWPNQSRNEIIAMWLYWFCLKPETYRREEPASWVAVDILKIYALGAHTYNLAPSWVEFCPEPDIQTEVSEMVYYSDIVRFKPPPPAVPAILSFIALVSQLQEQTDFSTPFTTTESLAPQSAGMEWEREWGRSCSLALESPVRSLADSFAPGSLEGVWEGLFTYTEFTAYAALLQGAPPHLLQKSLVVRHRQTWKLREHHLISPVPSQSDFNIGLETTGRIEPLSAGDPLRSYFPTGTSLRENEHGLEIREPGRPLLHYQRASSESCKARVVDIIITGEGHSAWGQFSLVGRIRPGDGFINLSKDYIDGDRGKWLYRGYLVGNVNGNLAGRWRDTVSAVTGPGYEGCFTMARRR